MHEWQQARDLGIPWQEKRWTSLTTLMDEFNDAVAQVEELEPIAEDASLSGSAPGESQMEAEQADSSRRDLPRAPRSEPASAPRARAGAQWPELDGHKVRKKV